MKTIKKIVKKVDNIVDIRFSQPQVTLERFVEQ